MWLRQQELRQEGEVTPTTPANLATARQPSKSAGRPLTQAARSLSFDRSTFMKSAADRSARESDPLRLGSRAFVGATRRTMSFGRKAVSFSKQAEVSVSAATQAQAPAPTSTSEHATTAAKPTPQPMEQRDARAMSFGVKSLAASPDSASKLIVPFNSDERAAAPAANLKVPASPGERRDKASLVARATSFDRQVKAPPAKPLATRALSFDRKANGALTLDRTEGSISSPGAQGPRSSTITPLHEGEDTLSWETHAKLLRSTKNGSEVKAALPSGLPPGKLRPAAQASTPTGEAEPSAESMYAARLALAFSSDGIETRDL